MDCEAETRYNMYSCEHYYRLSVVGNLTHNIILAKAIDLSH